MISSGCGGSGSLPIYKSKYILCKSQGLTAFYNIEYHINESSNTIDHGSEVKMYSFIIRDKKSTEILRKALVELP